MEKLGKMGKQIRRAASGMQHAFEAKMEAFHEVVGLWMKGGGVDGRNAKEVGKVAPDGVNKLRASIRGDGVRKI